MFQSPTNSLLLGIRLMPTDHNERMKVLEKVAIYPYAERKNPKPRALFIHKAVAVIGADSLSIIAIAVVLWLSICPARHRSYR